MSATPLRPTTSTGTELLTNVPSPSCPSNLCPQHFTVPVASNAHVWYPPVAVAIATAPVNPLTVTGTGLLTAVPSPSWPKLLSPQHFTSPVERSAQLWASPA